MELVVAKSEHLPKIMRMIEDAKAIMKQEKMIIWDDEYPLQENIEEDLKLQTGRLIVEQDEIAGYLSLNDDLEEGRDYFPAGKVLFVSRLVVAKEKRNQGIATKVFALIEELARKNHYQGIGLFGDIMNKPAIALYKKLKFRNLGAEKLSWGEENLFYKDLTNEAKGLKFISWNVNGLRAVMNKGFLDFIEEYNPDILALQETKMQASQSSFPFEGYFQYWNSAEKLGYSGTLILTKHEPKQVSYDLPFGNHPKEGRIITLEYEDYYFVNVYVPNSQRDLLRLDYRMQFENDFREYLIDLNKSKPVIICGDLNVAHEEIDLRNPKSNVNNAGFTFAEREKMTKLLSSGFIDTFRYLYPTRIGYSWWSYLFKARERNVGWRIDYFLVSERLKDRVLDSYILPDILGSDHSPVVLELKNDGK